MPTLSFSIPFSTSWTATVSIPYTLSYDAATNKTTVSFSQISASYPGKKNETSHCTIDLTISAGDNSGGANSQKTSQLAMTGNTTRPEGDTYTGTTSPASVTVQHSAGPGAKTVTVAAAVEVWCDPRPINNNLAPQYYYINGSGSRTDTSHTIPNASTITSFSASVSTCGSFNLSVNRYDGAYWHKATFKDAQNAALNIDDTGLETAFGTNLSGTVPRRWFNSHGSETSIQVTVSVQTYTDSSCTTPVGQPATATFTVNADSGMKPTFSTGFMTAAPGNTGAVSGISGYVQGCSKAALTFTWAKMAMANGASVTSVKVVCQSVTKTVTRSGSEATTTVLTEVLTGTSAIPITATVTDSRGRSASFALPNAQRPTPMSYADPWLDAISVFRCDDNGAASEDGNCYSVTATAKFSALDGYTGSAQNSAAITAEYKPVGGSWTGLTTISSAATTKLGSNHLDPDVSYIVRLTITDGLENSSTATVTIPTRQWALKIKKFNNGLGVGFGRAPSAGKRLELPADWEICRGTSSLIPTVKAYDFPNQSLAAKTQLYAYAPGISGFRCVSAYCSLSSSSSSVVLLSNPVFNPNANQWVARLFNPNDSAITVGGSVYFIFLPTGSLNFS